MIKRLSIIILFFYFLTLFQVSFLVHFDIKGIVPNVVLISIILINILETPKGKYGVISAIAGGFFLDVFSEGFIGVKVLILTGLACLIKLILKKYVRIQIVQRIKK